MNKKILITWGMSGLGWEIVNHAISKGYSVDILDISPWKIDLEKINERIKYINFDITKFNKNDINNNLSIYDIVICNAGISISGDFLELDFDAEKKVFDVNILWHIKLVKILLQEWKIHTGGRIWFTVSASELLPFPIALSYAGSKWAMSSFANALRSYLYNKKIKVSCIYPGPMDTPHVKYYWKKQQSDDNTKVKKIAKKSLNGIIKWKRNIYPDLTSSLLSKVQFLSPILDKIMYNTYKEKFKI